MTDVKDIPAEFKTQLDTCKESLLKLQETCCIAKRSEGMNQLVARIDGLEQLAAGYETAALDEVTGMIGAIESVGETLGRLYATCCTPVREPLYVAMFKSLVMAHKLLRRRQRSLVAAA